MDNKIKLIIFATAYAVSFTALSFIWPEYKMLWVSLEIIILPLIYYGGYEILMQQQKESLEKSLQNLNAKYYNLLIQNNKLQQHLKTIRINNPHK